MPTADLDPCRTGNTEPIRLRHRCTHYMAGLAAPVVPVEEEAEPGAPMASAAPSLGLLHRAPASGRASPRRRPRIGTSSTTGPEATPLQRQPPAATSTL